MKESIRAYQKRLNQMSKNNITISLIKSPIGSSSKQRKILESLGIKKINKTIPI